MGRAWKCATQAELPELLQGHLLLEAPGLSGEGPRFLRLSPWRGRTCGAEAGGVERCPPRGTLYFLALPCSVTTDQRGTGRERVSSTATQRRGSPASGPRPGVSEAAQGGRHPRFRASSDGYPTQARVQTPGVFKTVCANARSLARGKRTHGGSPWKQQQLQAHHGTLTLPLGLRERDAVSRRARGSPGAFLVLCSTPVPAPPPLAGLSHPTPEPFSHCRLSGRPQPPVS